MINMEEIQAKDVHIAVLNKRFRTTNYQSGGFIWWNETDVVQVIKRHKNGESHLWHCLKLEELVIGMHILDLRDTHLIVSKSHLDFINVNWDKLK